jgi:catecholate siderophore receptor
MNTSASSFPRRLLWASVLSLPLVGMAQTTARNLAIEDEPLVLSPFVVQSERDIGYRATSTLAGSRLNTPLSDIGASVSVLTKDLIEDLGATSVNDLLIYTGNTEASGINGNFSGAVNYADQQTIGFGDRSAPQDATRTRGMSGPTRTRNYFIGSIPNDSYNVDSVTVVRGPNSVLFGAGSPSGVVETSLLKADVNRNRSKLEFRYGNNDAQRAVVEHNQVLLKGKLAARIALLRDREKYNQKPAFEDKDRAYGTVTYAPFRSTLLRVSGEVGKHYANRPIATLPFNSIPEAWFRDGQPIVDWRYYDDPALNPNAAQSTGSARDPVTGKPLPYNMGDWVGQFQSFRQLNYVWNDPFAPGPGYVFVGRAERAFPNLPSQPPHLNRDGQEDNLYWATTGNVGEVSDNRPYIRSGIPEFAGGRPLGLVFQGYTDYEHFDFRRRMIDQTSRFEDKFKSFNVALEQRVWSDRVGAQVEYDWQNHDRYNRAAFFSGGNQNHIRLDVTRTLPNGQANPNFGRPLIMGGSNPHFNRTLTDFETVRATAYLRYNFADVNESLGRWLGSHTLTGLVERYGQKRLSYQKAFFTSGTPSLFTTSNNNLDNFSRRPILVTYIGPNIFQTGKLQLEPIASGLPYDGQVVQASYYDWNDATIKDAPARLNERTHGGTLSQEQIDTRAGVLQSYWLADHLITLVGMRRDSPKFGSRSLNIGINAQLPLDEQVAMSNKDWSLDNINFGMNPRLARTTRTYSGVLKWPKRWIALPEGTDASVFYNQSENFSPSGASRDVFLNILPSPTGETQEYGFALTLLHDKLFFRANRFETTSQNNNTGSGTMAAALNNGLLQRASGWLADTRVDRIADANKLLAAYPDLLTQANWQVTTNPNTGQRTATYNSITQNSSDTRDVKAEGYEFELTYNPTRNWRITANAAKQQTVQTNLLPRTKAIFERMVPIWQSVGNVPADSYQAGESPGNFAGENFQAYVNRLFLVPFAEATALEGAVSPEQREWRVNLIQNYTFSNSSALFPKLKGFNVGTGLRWQSKNAVGYPVSLAGTARSSTTSPSRTTARRS